MEWKRPYLAKITIKENHKQGERLYKRLKIIIVENYQSERKDQFLRIDSLEVLHRRAARIIYNLPRDVPTEEVYRHSNWNTLTLYYKLRLIKLLHSVFIGEAPTALSYLTNKPCTAYNFRRSNNIIVPRFNSQFLKNSISYRGAILWNAVLDSSYRPVYCFYRKVKKDSYFKELDFSAQSVQSLLRHYQDFKCF